MVQIQSMLHILIQNKKFLLQTLISIGNYGIIFNISIIDPHLSWTLIGYVIRWEQPALAGDEI